jgi:putative transposase
VVDSERYLLTCYRYVELNPVRAAMIESPGDYAWPSYGSNADGDPDPIVSPHASCVALGSTADKRRTAYRELVAAAIGDDELHAIRRYLQQQRALGSTRFQAAIEAMTGRCATTRDRGRPLRARDVADI